MRVRHMKNRFRSTCVELLLSTMWFLSGCEKNAAVTNPSLQSTPGSTKPLEAADLVGYDGTRLRKSVDRIKQSSDKHNQNVEKMAEGGPDQ